MRVLIVTAMYPTDENPAFGSFIKTQVEGLEQAGVIWICWYCLDGQES